MTKESPKDTTTDDGYEADEAVSEEKTPEERLSVGYDKTANFIYEKFTKKNHLIYDLHREQWYRPETTHSGKTKRNIFSFEMIIQAAQLTMIPKPFIGYWKKDEIIAALDLVHHERIKNTINNKARELSFDGNLRKELWKALVESICNEYRPEYEAAIKHFIWQVKRKLNGLDTDYEFMVILTGKQGSGKSTFVRKLVEDIFPPLFFAHTDFEEALDSRSTFWRCSKYVMFADELAKAGRAEISDIKRKITSKSENSRILGTNVHRNVTNNSTWIGCANLPVKEIIFDQTGMRRFFEIPTKDKFDWKFKVEALEYWKSVDENRESPIYETKLLFESIKALQEGITTKDPIREFVEEGFMEERVRPAILGDVKATHFYNLYKSWMTDQGRLKYVVGSNKFGESVRRYYPDCFTEDARKQGTIYHLAKMNDKYAYGKQEEDIDEASFDYTDDAPREIPETLSSSIGNFHSRDGMVTKIAPKKIGIHDKVTVYIVSDKKGALYTLYDDEATIAGLFYQSGIWKAELFKVLDKHPAQYEDKKENVQYSESYVDFLTGDLWAIEPIDDPEIIHSINKQLNKHLESDEREFPPKLTEEEEAEYLRRDAAAKEAKARYKAKEVEYAKDRKEDQKRAKIQADAEKERELIRQIREQQSKEDDGYEFDDEE